MINSKTPLVIPRDEYQAGEMMQKAIRPGAMYGVRHVSYGYFTGRCKSNRNSVTAFEIVEGNNLLADDGLQAGDVIDLGYYFFRAKEL